MLKLKLKLSLATFIIEQNLWVWEKFEQDIHPKQIQTQCRICFKHPIVFCVFKTFFISQDILGEEHIPIYEIAKKKNALLLNLH